MATKTKSKFSVKTYRGLNEKRYERKAGNENFGKRLKLDDEPKAVQFLTGPEGFVEIDMHIWKDENWHFVPCVGDDCPLCSSEDEKIRKLNYRMYANVWSFDDKSVKILEGPKDMATRIAYRFKRAKGEAKFLKKTYELTKLDTTPVSYDVALGEEPAIQTSKLTLEDLEAYVQAEAERYFSAGGGKSSLEAKDDDDLDNDADGDDSKKSKSKKSKAKSNGHDAGFDEAAVREALEALSPKKLAARATDMGVKQKKIDRADGDDDVIIDLIIKQVKTGAAPWEDDKPAKPAKAAKAAPAAKKAPARKPRK